MKLKNKQVKTKIKVLFPMILLASTLSMAQKTGYAPSEGVDIHYRVFGSGKPLLIINGGPGFSSDGFEGLAKKLSKKYRAILYDQRGTGKSKIAGVGNANMNMDLMVKDMEALRKHLDIAEWTILGHSFGGILANYYTALHPERVSGLIASSSGGVDLGLLDDFDINRQLSPEESDSLSYWTTRINEGDTTKYANKKRRMFFAAAYVYEDRHIPEIAERMTHANPTINALIWRDLQRIDYDVSEELSEFAKPVLIIQGKQDILQEKTTRKAVEVFPNAELVLLERCGHYGWLDRPDQYFESIFCFMEKI
jgi:proline iminopeptidase